MKRRWNRKFLAGAACGLFLGIGCVTTGFQNKDTELLPVEVIHVVKPQETLWGICEAYYEKDVGREKYLMEFRDEVVVGNPWLEGRHGQLHPGDTLKIVYYEKKPASAGTDTDI